MPEQFGVPENMIEDVIAQRLPPSVYSPYMSVIHDRHVIGINAAYLIGDWIDIIFFGDNKFFLAHREKLFAHPGLKISCNSKTHSRCKEVHYLPHDGSHPKGITALPKCVSWNQNSGAAAISLAVHLGVRRIILLGFDMQIGKYGQHWHNVYRRMRVKRSHGKGKGEIVVARKLPFERHLRGFPMIAKDAKKMGVEIINASPESAIEQFPKMTVKQILGDKWGKREVKEFVKPALTKGEKRFHWLAKMIAENGYTQGAEVGCMHGKTTAYVLQECKNLQLYCVDLWDHVPEDLPCTEEYKTWNFPKIQRQFTENTKKFTDRITVLKGLSWEMAEKVEDNSLDFVFIDADHEYESVIKDIKAWNPKLKPGGMICGHDIHFEGVKRAIDQIIPDWEKAGVDNVWYSKKEDVHG